MGVVHFAPQGRRLFTEDQPSRGQQDMLSQFGRATRGELTLAEPIACPR